MRAIILIWVRICRILTLKSTQKLVLRIFMKAWLFRIILHLLDTDCNSAKYKHSAYRPIIITLSMVMTNRINKRSSKISHTFSYRFRRTFSNMDWTKRRTLTIKRSSRQILPASVTRFCLHCRHRIWIVQIRICRGWIRWGTWIYRRAISPAIMATHLIGAASPEGITIIVASPLLSILIQNLNQWWTMIFQHLLKQTRAK